MITEIQGRKLRLLISAPEIEEKVKELGKRITEDYRDKEPVFIGILKGGFIFLADLARQVDFNVEIDFVRASSYKEGMEPGEVKLVTDATTPLKGRHVVLVEDMLDTGITLSYLRGVILSKEPASLKICALVDKNREETGRYRCRLRGVLYRGGVHSRVRDRLRRDGAEPAGNLRSGIDSPSAYPAAGGQSLNVK